MLIILVLETKNKNGSDYFYCRSILDRFYKVRGSGIKIDYVFMNGKGNYNKTQEKIKQFTSKYDGENKVIYFFDVDSAFLNFDQKVLNEEIVTYCNTNDYEIVWFNKTIEEVLTGSIVLNDKSKKANQYFLKNEIQRINESDLSVNDLRKIKEKQSNVLCVLNKYLLNK